MVHHIVLFISELNQKSTDLDFLFLSPYLVISLSIYITKLDSNFHFSQVSFSGRGLCCRLASKGSYLLLASL